MSDHTINQFRLSLKEQKIRIKKLHRILDQLNVLVHQQKRLSKCYKELSLHCALLSETMDHIDVIAFEALQELEQMHILPDPIKY